MSGPRAVDVNVFIIHYLGWQARECNVWIVATNPLGRPVRMQGRLLGMLGVREQRHKG